MASATTKLTFSFFHHHLNKQVHHHSSKPISKLLIPKSQFPSPLSLHKHKPILIAPHSVDVSQDDKPTKEQEQEQTKGTEQDELEAQQQQQAPQQNIDPRRVEEKFAVLNTGIYECKSCGYKYDESVGDSSYPIPPGLQFAKLPDDWRCPTCGAAQSFFQSKSVEIAGFAQNQQFGLGGNTLTSGQKALLIYGAISRIDDQCFLQINLIHCDCVKHMMRLLNMIGIVMKILDHEVSLIYHANYMEGQ